MPTRYASLLEAEAGLRQTRIPGVALKDGRFVAASISDDVGLGLIAPAVATGLGWPIRRAFDVLWTLLVAGSLLAAVLGILTLTSLTMPRLLGVAAATATMLLGARIGDLYLVMGAAPVAAVPWIIAASRRNSPRRLLTVAASVGAWAAVADLLRGTSGVILMVFLSILWGLSPGMPPRSRWSGLLTAFLTFALIWAVAFHLLHRRDAFLVSHAPTGGPPVLTYRHPMWHNVYIGLGWLKNDEVPAYLDEVGFAKVRSIDPCSKHPSAAYDLILKNEIIRLARTRPSLLLHNIFTKTATVLGYALIFSNVGWFALAKRRPSLSMDAAFLAAIAANGMLGVLVVPEPQYLFGLIAYCALFAAASFMLLREGGSVTVPNGESASEPRTYESGSPNRIEHCLPNAPNPPTLA